MFSSIKRVYFRIYWPWIILSFPVSRSPRVFNCWGWCDKFVHSLIIFATISTEICKCSVEMKKNVFIQSSLHFILKDMIGQASIGSCFEMSYYNETKNSTIILVIKLVLIKSDRVQKDLTNVTKLENYLIHILINYYDINISIKKLR